ncbi:hypothetical protein KB874_14015 [Aestuariicoccus sp. KMU-90]|uniref:Uncharacterized protein n=2 Tax=Thetidibacter halocola TaxID=2827239 RepID=A0A8J7WHG9_9RHOB|nr:hypothetical protein [Thetidibacter halocola]
MLYSTVPVFAFAGASVVLRGISFADPALMNEVRVGVLSVSIVSGILGCTTLMLSTAPQMTKAKPAQAE